jgi:hypothetical protein
VKRPSHVPSGGGDLQVERLDLTVVENVWKVAFPQRLHLRRQAVQKHLECASRHLGSVSVQRSEPVRSLQYLRANRSQDHRHVKRAEHNHLHRVPARRHLLDHAVIFERNVVDVLEPHGEMERLCGLQLSLGSTPLHGVGNAADKKRSHRAGSRRGDPGHPSERLIRKEEHQCDGGGESEQERAPPSQRATFHVHPPGRSCPSTVSRIPIRRGTGIAPTRSNPFASGESVCPNPGSGY